MTFAYQTRRTQGGMTLIELMIALLIGAFLLGGIIQIFVNSKRTYAMQDNLARLQENGRFAMDFISTDIRMAGYRGCNRSAAISSILNTPTAFLYNFNTPLQGFESSSATAWTPSIDAAITSPLGGSDVITLRGASQQSNYVTAHASGTADLTLASTTELAANVVVLVSACGATNPRVFQITGINNKVISHAASGTPGNATQTLTESYAGGEVSRINTTSYYVRQNSGEEPGLYRRIASSNAEKLVDGIENMQILYGEDTDMIPASGLSTDNTPNYYVPANAVVDMLRVVSIRISLTARTADTNLSTSGDGRLRRVFTSTIAVRNRLQ